MSIARVTVSPPKAISRAEREGVNGHRAAIVWMTGLPGAGKSTLATALARTLFDLGYQVTVLDGDRLRQRLSADLGFSHQDRRENVRRAGEVAGLFFEAGFLVIAALISPYRADRDLIRAACPDGYHEVYIRAPSEIYEARDPKGQYQAARAGILRDFTGISAPYEPPLSPELIVDTACATVEQSLNSLTRYVRASVPLRNARAVPERRLR